MKMKQDKFGLKDVIVIILDLLQDVKQLQLSKQIYFILIVLQWTQIVSFVFKDHAAKKLQYKPNSFVALVLEVSMISNIVQKYGTELITYLVFFFCFIWILLIYIVVLYSSLLQVYNKQALDLYQNKEYYIKFRNITSVFFQCFGYCFLVPMLHIGYGITVCGSKGYIRSGGCANHGLFNTILGFIFSIMLIVFSIFLTPIYRDYEFLSQNPLRKKYHSIQNVQNLLKIVLVILDFADNDLVMIKSITGISLAVSYVVEFIYQIPLRDKQIGKLYLSTSIVGLIVFICTLLWNNMGLEDHNMFFIIIFSSPVLIQLGLKMLEKRYWSLMFQSLDQSNPSPLIGFLLEEIMSLYQDWVVNKNQRSKMILHGIFLSHKKQCKNKNCFCSKQKLQFINSNTLQIEEYNFIKTISQIFMNVVQSGQNSLDPIDQDYLCLKFFTFQSQFEGNPVLTYYNLQSNLLKKENRTLFFQSISIIIQRHVRASIGNEKRNEKISSEVKRKDHFEVFEYQNMEIQKTQLVIDLKNCLKTKNDYFKKLYKGFRSLDELNENIQSLQKQVEMIHKVFDSYSGQIKQQNSLVIYLIKLKQCFDISVLNNVMISTKMQKIFGEIKKKDSYKDENEVSSIHIVSQISITVTVSFLAQYNKIVSPITKIVADFFGYNPLEIEKNNTITLLQPRLVGDLHDTIIKNYINRNNKESGGLNQFKVVFAVGKEGFSFPVSIYIDNVFPQFDDFLIGGILIKSRINNQIILVDRLANIFSVTRPFYELISQHQEASEEDDEQNQMTLEKLKSSNLGIFIDKIGWQIRATLTEGPSKGNTIMHIPKQWTEFEKSYTSLMNEYLNSNKQQNIMEDQKNDSEYNLIHETKFKSEFSRQIDYEKIYYRINYSITPISIYLNDKETLNFFEFEVNSYKQVESKKAHRQQNMQNGEQVRTEANNKTIVKEVHKTMDDMNQELEDEQKVIENDEQDNQSNKNVSDDTQFQSDRENKAGVDDDQQKQEHASVAASSSVEQVNQMKTLNDLIKKKTTPYLIRTLYVIEFMKLMVYLLFNIIFIVIIQQNMSQMKSMQPNSLSQINFNQGYVMSFEAFQYISVMNLGIMPNSNKDMKKKILTNYYNNWKEQIQSDSVQLFKYNQNIYLKSLSEFRINNIQYSQFNQIVGDVLLESIGYNSTQLENEQLISSKKQFFSQNILDYNRIGNAVKNEIYDEINKQVEYITSLFYTSNIVALVIFILLQFTSFPIYKKILLKLENFFIAGTRITSLEGEVEMVINECAISILDSEFDEWVDVDFTALSNYFYFSKQMPEFLQNSVSLQKQLSNQLKIRDQLIDIENQNSSNITNEQKRLLSDKIYEPQLERSTVIISYLMSFVVVSIFFGVMLAYQLDSIKQFNALSQQTKDYLAISSYTFKAPAYLNVFLQDVNENYETFKANYTISNYQTHPHLSNYLIDYNLLKQKFVKVMPQTKKSDFSGLKIDQIFYILKGNLCDYINTQMGERMGAAAFSKNPGEYETCKSLWNGSLQNGLINAIQDLISYFDSIDVKLVAEKLIQTKNKQEAKTIIKNIYQSTNQIQFFIFHSYIVNGLVDLNRLVVQDNIDLLESSQNMLTTILIVGITIYSFVFIISFTFAVKKLMGKYLASIFLLQVIPYRKLQADKVIQAHLKNLKNFVEKNQ